MKLCLLLLISVNMVARGILALLETIGTPLFIDVVLTTPEGVVDSDATQVTGHNFIAA